MRFWRTAGVFSVAERQRKCGAGHCENYVTQPKSIGVYYALVVCCLLVVLLLVVRRILPRKPLFSRLSNRIFQSQ
jgi:hypothetical protein